MMKAGTIVLSVTLATTSCQAFHIPARGGSIQQQQNNYKNHVSTVLSGKLGSHGRPRGTRVVSMSPAEDTVDVGTQTQRIFNDEVEEEDPEEAKRTREIRKAEARPKRVYTKEEKAYLKRLETTPTLYKRIPEADTIASIGYDGAFESLEEKKKKNYTGNPMVTDEETGKEVMLLRVVVWGAGEVEANFLKSLSDNAAGKLVSGLYVLWDPLVWQMPQTIVDIPFINVHELGAKQTKDPAKVAKHAAFLRAHMVIVASEPAGGTDFVTKVKAEALQRGVTFVGPGVATEVANGNLETFKKLVDGTREAMQ